MAKAKSKPANIVVWIILGLLIVGLAGFGVDGFGGSVRSIGKVGDRDIRVNDYFRALQQEIRAAEAELGRSLSLAEAQQFGLDQAVRAQLVTVAALENETLNIGISVGDDYVAQELQRIPAFQGFDGQFSREAYRFALQQEGLSESAFEEQVRVDTARSILQAAVTSGVPAPAAFTDAIVGYIGERRNFTVAVLDRSDLEAPVPAPDDADLRAHYEANEADFTEPEARRISFAWITPSMIIDTVEVDEAALRDLYEANLAQYVRPERRLVERLIFANETEAREALERIESGEADFADAVAGRGLDLADVDMGDVTRDELDPAAAEAVFALDAPGVIGPFDTAFGPALYRMNGILAAQETPFEEVRDELRDELARDRARRVIRDQYDLYEDLLAGGATVEQLAEETEMQFGQIDFRPDTRSGIAAYEAFRDEAEAVGEGDFPVVRDLEDGGLFALRLDDMVPPRLQPFDEVVVRVIEGWEIAEIERRLSLRADEIVQALERGESLDELGIVADSFVGVTRNDFLPDVPRQVIAEAFEMQPGGHRVIAEGGVVLVVALDAVLPAETDTPEAEQLIGAIDEQLRQSIAQDLFTYYARRLEAEAGIRLDERAIQAVHQNFR